MRIFQLSVQVYQIRKKVDIDYLLQMCKYMGVDSLHVNLHQGGLYYKSAYGTRPLRQHWLRSLRTPPLWLRSFLLSRLMLLWLNRSKINFRRLV
jgi:hypothetical protein